ncbi:uncharacterized protein G2W53_030445 [Senna tora]|uniref:Uncharacterized protein n=1 Tax=Senna tora TaxID=362788 RepID=A0A834T7F9_9FABA|nr:uncharacterized protein G2W53_030445 [Senna tora]
MASGLRLRVAIRDMLNWAGCLPGPHRPSCKTTSQWGRK